MPASKDNQNARKHGAYARRVSKDTAEIGSNNPAETLIIKNPTLAETIRALAQMNEQILTWLAQNRDATPAATVLNAYRLMADNTARLARILQKQESQPDAALSWFEEALSRVNEEVELAIKLNQSGERHTA